MNQQNTSAKPLYVLGLLLLLLSLQHCKAKQTATMTSEAKTFENPVTYQNDIAPLMELKCTPCHFPDKGKKKFLDTYAAVKNNIDDILHRVQLPTTDKEFMPFKMKKDPLTEAELKLMKDWVTQGMPN